MRKNLNYSDVITVWLDEDENNKFEPKPGCAYCIHYEDAAGNKQAVNIFFDLISKTPDVDCCEICPFSRNKRPNDEPPCKFMICDGLAPIEFDFAADNTTLIFKTSYEPIFIDSEELEEGVLEDAARRRRELSFKLAGCQSLEEIEKEYERWVELTPGYLRDVPDLDELALKAVESRKIALGLADPEPAKKKKGRPRKVKEKKEETVEPPIAPAPEPKKGAGKMKSASAIQPTVFVPATDPPPVLYAPVDSPDSRKSEERRKEWEDALLELDKEAREWEIKAAKFKSDAKEAANVAKIIREKIAKLLSGGSENYVDETPLFNGIEDATEEPNANAEQDEEND